MRATSLYGYGSFQRRRLKSLAMFGRLVSTWDDHVFQGFIRDGVVERVPNERLEYTLTDQGAHMMFHAHDNERGIHGSIYGEWRTKGEARKAGDLKPEQELVIKVMRGGKMVTWEHPATCPANTTGDGDE